MPEPNWISVPAYAEAFQLTSHTVRKLIDAQLVRSFQVGRLVRVAALPALERAIEPPPPPPPDPSPALRTPASGRIPLVPGSPSDLRMYYRPPNSTFRVNGAPVPDAPGVYVVRSGMVAKIGYSANIRRRLYSLQANHYEPLPILGFFLTDTIGQALRLEHEIHEELAHARLRGEWFALHDEVVTALRRRGGFWNQNGLLQTLPRNQHED